MASESFPDAAPVTGRIFITGGTGYVGTNLREALAGRPLRLLVRNVAKAQHLAGPDVELVEGDVTRPETLVGKMDGCEAVIHLVAIISEEGGATFDKVIRQGTVNTVAEAQRAGVSRFLHMSAMGTRHDPRFGYFEAKWQAEQAVINLGALLAAAGYGYNDIVKTTIFLVDLADFATVNEIYGRAFTQPYPARSTIQVAALPKGGLVEIEAIAKRGGASG